jgi:phenylalanyl-tRNA synthetase beta chain
MRLLVSWLRDFVDVTVSVEEIAEGLALRGFEVASVEPAPDGVRPPWQVSQTTGDLRDGVIDFEITANRPDGLSVLGLAREVATLYSLPLTLPSTAAGAKIALKSMPTGESDRVKVTVEDADLCPRYSAAVADLTFKSSPPWLAGRLQAAGVRPISVIVDITNYVLLELGHPMHAFDLAKLAGSEIRVRRAKPGEVVTTLDGVERKLEPDMLVIADAGRAQAVAGVMGSAASEVSPATKSVVLESAYFKPASVRRTSKRLALKTEASSRFERGADINAPVVALERALALVEQIEGGRASGPIVDCYPIVREGRHLQLRRARLALLLGARVADADVERILRGLGLTVSPAADGWHVVAPTYRVDLLREADLIEEVGRHYGFDRLEPTFPVQTEPAPAPDPRIPRDELVRRVLTAAGLSEAVTFGFIEAKSAEAFGFGPEQGGVVAIANPLSATFDTLRPSLLPGLVDGVAHNRRHGRPNVGLFEIGARFSAHGETRGVGLAWTGARSEHWKSGVSDVDFFDVKGVVERLCDVLGIAPKFEAIGLSFLAPSQAAAVFVNGAQIGVLGQIAPSIAEQRGAPRQDEIFVAELDLDRVWFLKFSKKDAREAVAPLPRHPFVVRDLSIVVADTLPAEIIRGTIQAAAATTATPLVSVAFFDRYQGKGVPEGAVSLSVRLTFQASDRTLTDAEAQQSFDRILAALVHHHDAVQR